MSILNGLGAFAGSLGAFARQEGVKSLLNSAVAPPAETDVAPAADATVPPAASTDTPTPEPVERPGASARGGASAAGVPPELLPIYEAAAKRTGIPVEVLIAQGKQESNFRPDAIGAAGEIGIHQIKPSTAANPGYGIKGIDPATLSDPAVNINFAADYLKAKAGNPNFNDPAAVDAALAAYNGGGDKNYVANVRRYIGAS